MIRRHVADEHWLITQHDHALLSGQLAAHIGGTFQPLEGRAVRGIALHDCGWPLHDDQPTLNGAGSPLDVFESPREVAMLVWPESAHRAADDEPYAGLLVSLHVLWLSVLATTPTSFVHEKFNLGDAANRFEINRFQQQQVELQEQLRQRLGMGIDEPRRFGLAEQSDDSREAQLIYDFRMLQAMDKLSLALCCTTPPAEKVEPLPERPAGPDRPLHLQRDEADLLVQPWPFAVEQIDLSIPFRRLASRKHSDVNDLRRAYHAATTEQFRCRVRRG